MGPKSNLKLSCLSAHTLCFSRFLASSLIPSLTVPPNLKLAKDVDNEHLPRIINIKFFLEKKVYMT